MTDVKTLFILNESDISVVNYKQVIKKLPIPKIIATGDRLKYKFPMPLEVDG